VGRLLLIARLALRDLRRRRAETALLILAVMAATTTLTLGLVLRDAAADPYMGTRNATNGPDIVAVAAAPAGLDALAAAAGVTDHSGPFPVAAGRLRASDRESDVQIVGRDSAPVSVDQPGLVHGTWVRDGGAVLEAAFAAALGIGVGDAVTVNGRSFAVVGVAVTAATAPYPGTSCIVLIGCMSGPVPDDAPAGLLRNPGLIWLTQPTCGGSVLNRRT
jgi:predicted lysophospholipase L1 biosynthesis ABC-type transport system permease subunit